MKPSVLRAVNDTNPRPINDLGGAIAGAIKTSGRVDVAAVGPDAVYNALRSIMKAEEMIRRDEGWERLVINTHSEMLPDRNKNSFKYVRIRCVADKTGRGGKHEASRR